MCEREIEREIARDRERKAEIQPTDEPGQIGVSRTRRRLQEFYRALTAPPVGAGVHQKGTELRPHEMSGRSLQNTLRKGDAL